ncbi:MAG: hypothetical protein J6Q15_01530, partial [Clostridia bacterium]|nr:hypothetical protein [Clostridia bacterium]
MMRTKAKGLLVGVMLLIACCVFFACKEQTKIKVDSIAFTEQSISLLVGEEYTPKVKVLPSYATSRSYTLISNDTTALAIEGGTITALKAAMGVKLKVVSDEDENINDILSVNIYNEATELETPTELMFDGTKFTFVGKDNVNNYVLKVNGKEINIGNNTEYNIANIIDKVGEIYDDVVTCSVKASGDGKIFKDSPYSENISFVKLSSVSNIYVENETLYFNAIKNVASYTVEILAEGQEIQSKIVNNTSFNEKQLSLDITELTDSVNGCNYVIKVTPNSENYNLDVDVFEGTAVELNYAVVGKVQNIIITEKVISWNFVQNAQTYTIQIYKDGELLQEFSNIVTNQLEIPYNEEGEYSCKIIANSTNANTTTGKEYSSLLNFAILPSPELNIDDNLVTWSNVTGAEGYLITIKDSAGAMLLNQKFIITNSYDVSNFSAGKYYVELIACGNGENGQNQDAQVLLSSKVSNQATWTILQGVQVKIENQKLYWQDADASSLNKYRVKFDDVDIVLTSADYGIQYQYDATTNMFSYDLSGHNFAPSTNTVSVQSIGENNIFYAEINNINMIKLAESSISSLSNKQFTISPVTSAVSYKIEIYKADDLNNVIVTLNTRIGYNFTLDASVLEAGAYVAKVFTYGNNTLIFDADNSSATTHIAFEKLATPTIDVDKDNLKLVIDKNNIITSENKYNLFENNRNKNIVGDEYDLSGLTAGDYVYAAQAIGDNATILDSDVTISENEVKVKKLTTPNISFDKESLNFTISCIDDSYVDSYTFTLNEKNIAVTNYIADCSADIEDPGIYEAKVYANPQSVSAGYGLVIASNYKTHTVSKLAGLCDFQLSSGNLIVTPAETLSGSGYSLSLYIDNGENDIVLDRFTYTNSRFEMSLYDSKYNVIEAIKDIMQGAGEYSLFTTISQNDDNVVTSNETQCVNALKVLGKVTTITKNAQTIEFNSVANATNYIAVVEVNGTEYYIDIAGKYTTSANNVITIQDLLQLMEVVRVPYLEQTEYNISFVAVNEDTHTIDNKGINKYSFEFLKTPTLSVVEQDGNSKYLA